MRKWQYGLLLGLSIVMIGFSAAVPVVATDQAVVSSDRVQLETTATPTPSASSMVAPQADVAASSASAKPAATEQSTRESTNTPSPNDQSESTRTLTTSKPTAATASSTNMKPVVSPQGPWLQTDQYVTIKSPNYSIFSSFNWVVKQSSRQLVGQLFHVTAQYHHQNGSTYFSLYNAAGGWEGYINAMAVSASTPQGSWHKATGYVTISQPTALYANFSKVASDQLQSGHTYAVTGVYHWFDGTVYWSLYDQAKRWVGYVNADSVKKSDTAQGSWQQLSGYGRATGSYTAWRSFNFTTQTRLAAGQALTINGQYWHANGATYVSAYDLAGHWLGYLNARGYRAVATPQGVMQTDSRYVTITHRYTSYSDFDWHSMHHIADLFHKTFHTKGRYLHLNGNTYLSLYDNMNQWWGYINQNAVTPANSAKGAWYSASGYTSFANAQTTAYADLGSIINTNGAQLKNHTYKITGQYTAFDGTIWDSIYDNQSRWIGYVRDAQVPRTAAQGGWQQYNNYFTTTKKNTTIWSSFGFHGGLSTSSNAYQRTYRINGVYHHFNGSTYYSLYQNDGRWVGYINQLLGSETAVPQGQWMPNAGDVTLSVKGYPIWKGFFTDQVATSTSLFNKTYRATGKYRHVNGSLYYSLYSGKTWVGYVNAAATVSNYRVLDVPNYNQYQIGAPVGCEGVSLYQALKAKGYAGNYTLHAFLSTIPKASSPYNGFVGSPFVADSHTYTAIFAAPLAKWGNRFGKVINLSGVTVAQLEAEVLAGNPVVAYVTERFAAVRWGNWSFGRVPNNNHAVTIAGVDQANHRLYLSDPIDGKYWIAESKFAAIYNVRHMAVVVR